jgi:alkanesulfonate monooxygenase SsuD/methylene tetrahydromethanopterin reductase-like flavin-dependent oxidoreductase (luciferase family)/iron-sulfur cluster repair protein YtfE (RIC family)
VTDYLHDLEFGSFLTPDARHPDETVALAVLCERLGLDLVTFQDHPYQPGFLDTWTLLSFVAARTSTVRLSPNVANVPLRPPAVLARSAASLDLLSGGRVELALGAGAFWDAIVGMGVPRLSPGESVDALEEAIAVLRQVWDEDARGGVRVEGTHHRVVGAKRGPAPRHDIGLWVGALKPRMLRMIGRSADGWLPSLFYLQPGDLARGNAVIDQAAHEAGRDPRQVRRLLNVAGSFSETARGQLQGPPAHWAEELAQLALDEGVSTFILATDDARALQVFAEEVAPAVRELVDRGREVAADTPGPGEPGRQTGGTPKARGAVPLTRTALTVRATPAPTPRGTASVLDESARPVGPAPEAGRGYTPHEQAAGQHLVDIHDHLRAELEQLHDLVEQVAAGMLGAAAARSHISAMTLRQNKWVLGGYCESYCRVVTTHHTLEDEGVFPHLRRRDPRLAPVIDQLQVEHEQIHEVLEQVDRALVAFVSVEDGMAELRLAVDLLSDTLLSHLAYEEEVLIEPIARLGLG